MKGAHSFSDGESGFDSYGEDFDVDNSGFEVLEKEPKIVDRMDSFDDETTDGDLALELRKSRAEADKVEAKQRKRKHAPLPPQYKAIASMGRELAAQIAAKHGLTNIDDAYEVCRADLAKLMDAAEFDPSVLTAEAIITILERHAQ